MPRTQNQFCRPATAAQVFSAVEHYQQALRWWPDLVLLMPDHIHMLVSFPVADDKRRVISAWKHFLSAHHGIVWQRDFFDHRLRAEESYDEKARYIRHNPVRAGLIDSPERWPYIWQGIRR